MLVNFGESHYCSRVFMKTLKFMDTIGLASLFHKLFVRSRNRRILQSLDAKESIVLKILLKKLAGIQDSKNNVIQNLRSLERWNFGLQT